MDDDAMDIQRANKSDSPDDQDTFAALDQLCPCRFRVNAFRCPPICHEVQRVGEGRSREALQNRTPWTFPLRRARLVDLLQDLQGRLSSPMVSLVFVEVDAMVVRK